MSIYVIGIGGTGAKSIEAMIQLTAIGLFGEQSVKLLFGYRDWETDRKSTRLNSSH